MDRIFRIDVHGKNGYSFAVMCDDEPDLFDKDVLDIYKDEGDAYYATCEEITESPYDIMHFKDITYKIQNE